MNKIFISLFIFVIFLFNQILKLSANDDTYINSSNIIYNEKENIIELGEESKINFKDANILIERGIIDYEKNKFEVFGNFYLYEDLNILSGEDLRGYTNLDSFTANNVSFIYNDDLKIDSDKLIKENNLSASSFAKMIGVQRSSISHILSGRNNPSLDLLLKIHNAFNYISIEWLILGHNSMEKTPEEIQNDDKSELIIDEKELSNNKQSLLREIVYYYNDGSFERFFPKP